MYRFLFKRILDFLIAALFLMVLSPIFILITIILLFSNQGKPFFYQSRPGYKAKIFKVVKFKTMNDKKDKDGKLLPDNMRITGFGSFLRKSSLDEIPQMLNVLKGDMSLIGPRPLLVKYLPLYNDFQARRHEVKPGITGWAQVNGRNAIDWSTKFQLDVWYVDNVSLMLDIKIFFLTIRKILNRSDINNSELVTMQPFLGNN